MSRDEIIRMAREAGFSMAGAFTQPVERFAALVAAAEREACAKIVFENSECCRDGSELRFILQSNAAAIRARGANDPQ